MARWETTRRSPIEIWPVCPSNSQELSHGSNTEQTRKCNLVKVVVVSQSRSMKKEFIFQIEQDDDMLVATCHEPEMATQGENLDELIAMIRDLVRCRFDEKDERLGWP